MLHSLISGPFVYIVGFDLNSGFLTSNSGSGGNEGEINTELAHMSMVLLLVVSYSTNGEAACLAAFILETIKGFNI